MKKRATFVEKFSTYLWRDENGVLVWVSDRPLQRHMAQMVDRHPERDEKTWVMYWLEAARKGSDRLAVDHLRSHLEEPCYWGAVNAHQKYPTGNWWDYFQMARELAADPVKLWKNYDPQLSQPATYANKAFLYAILEQVRQKSEFDRSSDWGLLSKVSKTKLKKALKNASISEPQLSRYLLAWQCFQEICTLAKAEGTRKLESPTAPQLEDVARYYNELRFPQSSEPAVNGDRINQLLLKCIETVRNADRIPNISLDANPVHSQAAIAIYSEAQSELQAELARDRAEWQEIKEVLDQAIATLPEEVQKVYTLKYGFAANQTAIAQMLKVNQSTVSRYLKANKQPLLSALGEWVQSSGNSLTIEKNQALSKQLNEWLKDYYQTTVFNRLSTKLLAEHGQEIPLLQFSCAEKLPPQKIAKRLKISENEVKEKVTAVKQCLQQELNKWMRDSLKLSSELNGSAVPLAKLVDNWLINAPYAILEMERR